MKHYLIAIALCTAALSASATPMDSLRPTEQQRLFRSKAIDQKIKHVTKTIDDPILAWMFEGCFPNTLDTTIHFEPDAGSGEPDTYIITGDIPAMWLRDSGAQVWPYLQYMKQDPRLQQMIRGLILRQFACIRLDPYANAFLIDGTQKSEWAKDGTTMLPGVWERKYEIDSLCYPLRLAYEYWRLTGDASIFDQRFLQTLTLILDTFQEQQRKNGPKTSYVFTRMTVALHDTTENYGYGHPAKACGLIASTFRPSDDSTILPFLIPSNFFAVSVLEKAADILAHVTIDPTASNTTEASSGAAGGASTTTASAATLRQRCLAMADEVRQALHKHAVVDTPDYGKVYAFEVDGRGNVLLMDDANAPSLLALPYLCDVPATDPIYQNTRRMIFSDKNPYYFEGKPITLDDGTTVTPRGIGSPHTGYDQIWPMSIIMRGLTSSDPAEIDECLRMLKATTGGTGFIHESFDKDNPATFTRAWFSWANGLFAELVMKRYAD